MLSAIDGSWYRLCQGCEVAAVATAAASYSGAYPERRRGWCWCKVASVDGARVRFENAVATDDRLVMAQFDREFHNAIAMGSHNTLLVTVSALIQEAFADYRRAIFSVTGWAEGAVELHARISLSGDGPRSLATGERRPVAASAPYRVQGATRCASTCTDPTGRRRRVGDGGAAQPRRARFALRDPP